MRIKAYTKDKERNPERIYISKFLKELRVENISPNPAKFWESSLCEARLA